MIQIRKILLIPALMVISAIAAFAVGSYDTGVNSNSGTYTLQAGVSMIERVPNHFYGTWRVIAKLSETRNYDTFKPNSIDIWNLSREGNVINISNPYTGASATINVSYAEGNLIKFSKTGNYDSKRLTDIVELKITGDKFTGINRIILETLSNVDNSVIKKQSAIYILQGEKVSGTNMIGK